MTERLERLALAVLVVAAAWAFARSPLAAAPCAVLAGSSLFWQLRRVPEGAVAAARRVVAVVVGVVVLLGWTLMTVPVLSPAGEALVTSACGHTLALLAGGFLLSPRFPRPSLLYPSVAALLALASFDPTARVRPAVAVAGAALVVLLQAAPARRWTVSRAVVLALCVAPAFFIARWIIGFLPVAQAKVEEYGMGMLAPGASASGLSTRARLGELASLKLSRRIVLRVFAPAARKLRGRVYVGFDGRGWTAADGGVTPLAPLDASALPEKLAAWSGAIPGTLFGRPASLAAGAGGIPGRVLQAGATPGLMVAPGGVRLVRAPVESMALDTFGLLRPPPEVELAVYGVVSPATGDVAVPGPADPALVAACLALPPDTDPRLVELAGRLAAGATTARQKLERTVDHVAGACHYSLDPGPFRTRQPVAEFLFEKKRGYCEYFASAAAVLLRLEGVPARYVTGYNVQEGNRAGGHYVVRESDAHAWIEAFVPGSGWVEADPTPADEYAALHAERPDLAAAALEWVKAEWAGFLAWLRLGDWRSRSVRIGLAFGLLGLALLVRAGLRRWRAARPGRARPAEEGARVRPELRELLARADRFWARAGHPRPASRAPLEHARSLPPDAATPELREASLRVVECYYRERFGGVAAPPEELDDLSRRVPRL